MSANRLHRIRWKRITEARSSPSDSPRVSSRETLKIQGKVGLWKRGKISTNGLSSRET